MPTLYDPKMNRYSAPIQKDQCRAEVYERISRNWHQCVRKAVVEVDGVGYCRQHSPDAEAARNSAKQAKYDAERARDARQWQRPGEYLSALREIAAGHNDPRALATEILTKWGDLDPR